MRKLAAFAASFSAAVFAWAYGLIPLLALLALPALGRTGGFAVPWCAPEL